jgi:hypothetical protein
MASRADAAVAKVAQQIAEDIHLDGLTPDEEPLLPPGASSAARNNYVLVGLVIFACS